MEISKGIAAHYKTVFKLEIFISDFMYLSTLFLDMHRRGIDMEIYHGATFQRVYQYLRRDKAGRNLDGFTYQGLVEGTIQDSLALILR